MSAHNARLSTLGSAALLSLMLTGWAPAQTLPRPIVLGSTAHVAGTGTDMATNFSTPAATEHQMKMEVGHSIFVNTKHRLSRVYITNPAILDSYTANPNQIVVTAKVGGLSNIILWDESGDSQVYTVEVDSNLDELRRALKSGLPHETVDVKSSDGRIILTGTVGTKDVAESAMKIASVYAKEVSNGLSINSSKVRQIRLKVRFVEVDRSKGTQFGVNFFGQPNGNLVQTTTSQFQSSPQTTANTGTSTVTVSDPLNFFFYNYAHNIGATLKDLASKQLLQILAEPNITAMNGQKASFLAGGEFPFPVVQGGANGFVSVSIQFRPYGVKLDFTPVVNQDGTIDLTISPEVSALDYTNSVQISGYTIPAISTRRASTEVVLRDGQSFAITGLLDRRTTDSLQHTPGIANIPILGQLFRSKSLSHSLSELVVIVTPEIIDPLQLNEAIKEPKMVVPPLDPNTFDPVLQKKEAKFNNESKNQ